MIPTDLMFAAWRQLFPAERMVVFGGQQDRHTTLITSLFDVTEERPTAVHVRSHADRLTTALVDLERTGAHLAVWMHSHPGEGPGDTRPSVTDHKQDEDLRHHYSPYLFGIIVVRDGWLRLWGLALTENNVRVEWKGRGIEPHPKESHVYRFIK